ncbi:MAG: SAM-dependent methyltransferase [Cyanobacteriota/Melainabacteria group bacterium]
MSCHKFSQKSRFKQLNEAFEKGMDVALMSDTSTLLSDPGQSLVSEAISLGFEICAVPGPTAWFQAPRRLHFPAIDFPSRVSADKEDQLRKLLERGDEKRTLVFYVSPHSLLKRIDTMIEVLGDRNACLAKELTKKFERYFRGTLSSIKQELNEENLKGEFTLVLAGKNKDDELKVDVSDDTVTDFILDAHRRAFC